jgi:predicted nucleic acid-binding protein
MISFYFDATYLCKLRWWESGSTEVTACAAQADELVCSLHGRAEFYSVGHRKLREGAAKPSDLAIVFAQFRADCAAGGLRLLPLTEAIVDRVESVYAAAPSTAFLRAADALHLATAAEHGFSEVYSNDRHLLAAAPLFGLSGVNVVP